MNERFHLLTKYIDIITTAESFGQWVIDHENDGTSEHPMRMPYVAYSELVNSFEQDFYRFVEAHPEFRVTDYSEILATNGIGQGSDKRSADVSSLNVQCVLALIMGTIRAERFCDGALLGSFEDGSMAKWLKRLRDIETMEG